VQEAADGGQKGSTAVDGEHPDGGFAFQGHVPAAERVKGGKENFHAPAGEAAFEEIVCKVCQGLFYHNQAPFLSSFYDSCEISADSMC